MHMLVHKKITIKNKKLFNRDQIQSKTFFRLDNCIKIRLCELNNLI